MFDVVGAFFVVVAMVPVVSVVAIDNDDFVEKTGWFTRTVSLLSQRHRREFLTAHNQRRSSVQPPAVNMRKMVFLIIKRNRLVTGSPINQVIETFFPIRSYLFYSNVICSIL